MLESQFRLSKRILLLPTCRGLHLPRRQPQNQRRIPTFPDVHRRKIPLVRLEKIRIAQQVGLVRTLVGHHIDMEVANRRHAEPEGAVARATFYFLEGETPPAAPCAWREGARRSRRNCAA